MLGETGSVVLTLKVDEAEEDQERPLRLAANVGSFGEVTREGPGTYHVVYVPPTTRFPQVALIAVWKETGPEAPIDFVRVPLHGRTKLPLGAPKGTELKVRVGSAEFGPVVAEGRSTEITLAVPPGVREATVVARSPAGAVSTRTVAIATPPYDRLTAALTPHALAPGGRGWARLEVYYDAEGREPPPPSEIKVLATSGTVSLMGTDQGRYTYRYQPSPPSGATGVDFNVLVAGDSAATARTRLSLGLPPPARLVLRPPTEPMACDGEARAPVELCVLDAEGLGLPGLSPKVSRDGTPMEVRDAGAGRYLAMFTAPALYPPGGLVHFEASVGTGTGPPLTTAANYQLQPAPRAAWAKLEVFPAPVPADGHSAAEVTLLVRDSAGKPARSQQFIAVASAGSLGELREVEPGRYVARYTPPSLLPESEATLKVVDAAGEFEHRGVIPLREPVGHLLVGARAGFFYDFAHQYGPRGGLDVWAPLRLGAFDFGVGLSATYGQLRQTVTGTGTGTELLERVGRALRPFRAACRGRSLFGAAAGGDAGRRRAAGVRAADDVADPGKGPDLGGRSLRVRLALLHRGPRPALRRLELLLCAGAHRRLPPGGRRRRPRARLPLRSAVMRLSAVLLPLAIALGCGGRPREGLKLESMRPDLGATGARVEVEAYGRFVPLVRTDFADPGRSTLDLTFTGELLPTAGGAPIALEHLFWDAGHLDGTVPATLPLGTYDLRIVGPDGAEAILPSAYRAVTSAESVASLHFDAVEAQRVGQPFVLHVTALNAVGRVVDTFDGEATLGDLAGASTSVVFERGRLQTEWVVREAWPADVLWIEDRLGHRGESEPFDVLRGLPVALGLTPELPAAIQAGACAGPFTVSLLDSYGSPPDLLGSESVDLWSNPSGPSFSTDAACTSRAGRLALDATTGAARFFITATAAGAWALGLSTASAPSLTRTVEVVAAPAHHLAVTGAAPLPGVGQCSPAHVELLDPFGNPAVAQVALPVEVRVTPPDGLATFSDPQCAQPLGALVLAYGEQRLSFAFRADAPGRYELSLTAPAAAIQPASLGLKVEAP
ncbi:MAG: Ig-like domain-containing protein [Myxococcales bacterium]